MRITEGARAAQRGVDIYQADLSKPQARADGRARASIPDGIDPPVPPSGPAQDAELPWSIRMQVPNTEQDVDLPVQGGWRNPPIVAGAFKLAPSGGVRTVYVTCGKDAKP